VSVTDVEGDIDYTEFKSISLVLEEARHRYDEESNRFQGLESKAGVILSTEAIVLTIITILRDKILHFWLPFCLLLTSILLGALSIKIAEFRNPGKKDDYYKYAKMEQTEFLDKLLLSYYTAIRHNEKLNDKKLKFLKWSYYLLLLSFLLIILFALI
jgi:hypothetical protein